MCEIDIGNPKYTTFTKLVQVRNFITYELKIIRHEERETQSSYADCFYIARSAQIRLATPKSESRLSRSEAGTQLTDFFSNPQILSPQFPCVMSLTSPGPNFSIWDFYFDISEWHILSARAWTPALMLHLTNPCTKRKALILTKPKGKIDKTRSLRIILQ